MSKKRMKSVVLKNQRRFLVFVYGTLKRGHSNNYLLPKSSFVGPGVTRNKYVMYKSGVPFVSKSKEQTIIGGELYSVIKETLNILDALEGHPQWYKREETKVDFINKEGEVETVDAWLYFCEDIPQGASEVEGGIYLNPLSLSTNARNLLSRIK